MDPVPDPILPEKFLKYSLESNSGPLGWQSDVLTTIPNRLEYIRILILRIKFDWEIPYIVGKSTDHTVKRQKFYYSFLLRAVC